MERLLEPARKKRARTAAQPSRAHANADKDKGELQTQAARARRVFFSVSCASKIVPDGCHATSQIRKADIIFVHDLADVQRELLAHTVCILRGRQLQTSDSEGDQCIKFERGNVTRKLGIHISTNFESMGCALPPTLQGLGCIVMLGFWPLVHEQHLENEDFSVFRRISIFGRVDF